MLSSIYSVTPAELIRKWHVTVIGKKESHRKSKYLRIRLWNFSLLSEEHASDGVTSFRTVQ